jgi:hypothetical protein
VSLVQFAGMVNACSETVTGKPSFRTAAAQRRAVIPANGYYEMPKNDDGTKTPHIRLLVPADWSLRSPIDYVDGCGSYSERALGRIVDSKVQVVERSARQPSIMDRVFSIIFLVVQPFVAVAQYLIAALGASDWMDGTRSIPQWAATTACMRPEPRSLGNLFQPRGIGEVRIRLVPVEAVLVPPSRRTGPDRVEIEYS